ncbi:F0F1 ATP synthase subunit A [Pelolinea submarina]|uniref:ATP synthase subunit a n=1 Tax=Pelolinea submarina TaxID=913107 RepID=A0A347ZV54_9CHLR|nr:F0F1 ATP synthase subunit A [Pelolinea submarina]REG10229.1 ATP synthase F0 subcomplex A subunit [Pelolinea submarina]BBB49185.1 F-type H+-transporting ATPase subunit a [Pelolinea submarina]
MESVTPQVVFTLFGLPVRSTVLATWVAMGLIILVVLILDKTKPHLLENFVEFISNMIAGVMNLKNVERYLPVLGTLIIFISVANTLGALPLLTSPTSDINTTIALSLVVFFAVHIYGIRANGFFRYTKNFASPIFLLPLEIIGQVSRAVSLALRLFGNILSGELIVAIVFSLIPVFVPLPLMGLSLLIGILQAYVFTALSSVYISTAVEISDN